MKIYVDFDDVLSETAAALAGLLPGLFGKRVAYEDICAFDLRVSFKLSEPDYRLLMDRGHEASFLEDIPPAPGAREALRAWQDKGWEPVVVTGRPASCHDASATWLARHGFAGIPLIHVDKYGRDLGAPCPVPTYSFPQLRDMGFGLAIDDAPPALALVAEHGLCPAIIFDRPWNRTYSHPDARRMNGWGGIE